MMLRLGRPHSVCIGRDSHYKLQLRLTRDQSSPMCPTKEATDRFAALLAVVERPVVYIHPNELVRQLAAHVARVLERVLDCFRTVVETELDAGSEDVRDGFANARLETLVDDVPAKRKRETFVLAPPPNAEIFADLQAFILIGELAFVNDQANFRLTGTDCLEDLIERHNHVIDFPGRLAQPELQREEGAGHRTRDGNLLSNDLVLGEPALGHEHRSI